MAIFRHRQRGRAREADAYGDRHDGANAEPQHDHSAGGLLRETREGLRWDLRDIAAALRIRPEYLESLERNSVEGLPGPAYASGFLRAYAEYLRLDSGEVMRRFRTTETGLEAKSELAFPVPLTDRGIPGGGIFLIALLLGVIGYGLYYFVDTSGIRPAEQAIAPPPARLLPPPPSPQQLAVAEPAKPVEAPSNTPPTASASAASSTPSGPTTIAGTAPVAATILASAPDATGSSPVGDGTPVSSMPTADPEAAKSSAARSFGDATPGRIVIRATGKTWVVVKDGEKPILNRLLDKGDIYNAPDRKGLIMRTGSVGAIEVVVDGRTLPAFGPVGQVKTVQLDADKLASVTPHG